MPLGLSFVWLVWLVYKTKQKGLCGYTLTARRLQDRHALLYRSPRPTRRSSSPKRKVLKSGPVTSRRRPDQSTRNSPESNKEGCFDIEHEYEIRSTEYNIYFVTGTGTRVTICFIDFRGEARLYSQTLPHNHPSRLQTFERCIGRVARLKLSSNPTCAFGVYSRLMKRIPPLFFAVMSPKYVPHISCLNHPLEGLHGAILLRNGRAQEQLVVELGALEGFTDGQNLDVASEQRDLRPEWENAISTRGASTTKTAKTH